MPLALTLVLAATAGSDRLAGFDCDRAVVDGLAAGDCAAKFGKIIDARPGPRVAGHATVEVRYEPEPGKTSFQAETALLQRDGAAYRLLWRHKLVDVSYGLGPWGHLGNAITYRWSYDARRQRIAVTGYRTASRRLNAVGADLEQWLAKPPGRTHRFAPRFYCYSAGARFARCYGP